MSHLQDSRETPPAITWEVTQFQAGVDVEGDQAYSMTGYVPEGRRSMMFDVVNKLVSEAGFTILASKSKSIPLTALSVAQRQVSTIFPGSGALGTDHDTTLTLQETGLTKTDGAGWTDVNYTWWAAHDSTQCPWVLVRAPASMGSFEMVISLKCMDTGGTANGLDWLPLCGSTFICRMGESGTWDNGVTIVDGDETPVPYSGKKWCFLTNQSANNSNLADGAISSSPSYNGFGWTPYDDVNAMCRWVPTRVNALNDARVFQYLGMHCSLIVDDSKRWVYLAFSCRLGPNFTWAPCGLWAFGKKPEAADVADGARVPSYIDPSLYPTFKKFYGSVGIGNYAHNIAEPLGSIGALVPTNATSQHDCLIGSPSGTGLFGGVTSGSELATKSEYYMSADQAMSGDHRTQFSNASRVINPAGPLVWVRMSYASLVVRSLSGKVIADLSDMPTVGNSGLPNIDVKASHFALVDYAPQDNAEESSNLLCNTVAENADDYDGDLGTYATPVNSTTSRNIVGTQIQMVCLDPYDRGDSFFLPDLYIANVWDGFQRMRITSTAGDWMRHGCFILPWVKDQALDDDGYLDNATYPTGSMTFDMTRTNDAGFSAQLPATM